MKLLYIIILIICFGTISCTESYVPANKEKLSGYWEIATVQLPDGSLKNFSFNAVLDFIEITDISGLRTKVSPQIDGSFKTNGTSEKFIPKMEDDSLRLYYKTPFDSWKETVIIATDSILEIVNRDNKHYRYRRFIKFDFGN